MGEIDDNDDESWDFDDDDDIELQKLIECSSNGGMATNDDLGLTANHRNVELSSGTHHRVNYNNLRQFIYPANFEIRDYQYNIVQRAFYDNLLVALPTGLGKTFIASTVMLNFLRWFPDSRIVFMAPTKPLVAQQIKACCSITGLPTDKVAILLDKTRKNRDEIWASKQVFFTTPQLVENDLTSGLVDPKSISLLVIDEAHRAKGRYAYNNVTQYLNRFNRSFRVLALTATPASDVEGVQQIITNLLISKVELRTETSIDLLKYMKNKRVERRNIDRSPVIAELVDLLCTGIEPVLELANDRNIYAVKDPSRINHFQCMEASQRIIMDPTMSEGLKWLNYFMLQLLGVVGQCFRRLNIYGVRSFYSYFNDKSVEFTTKWNKKKSTNKMNAEFYSSEPIKACLLKAQELCADPAFVSHPKVEVVIEELKEFFAVSTDDSKVIIFTEFRESALELVQTLALVGGPALKPHIFIGQAKEKDKFDDQKYAASLTKLKKKLAQFKEQQAQAVKNRPTDRSSSEEAQSKGMNQKMQKEVIHEFKKGTYNILVATSIGEEGLDIGEVDLIVCFDSTGSPIKNVQRMGRTGRKREGKVLLLFSSNEESKFDKAMAGYEHVQNHIMKGKSVDLAPQNRMIPIEFKPEPKMEEIVIPEENLALKFEDDEDEIVKIATRYMLGGNLKAAPKKRRKDIDGKSSKKKQKHFNMPDNVPLGFQSVTSMLKIPTPPAEAALTPRKTILDSFLTSESESEELLIALGQIHSPRRSGMTSKDEKSIIDQRSLPTNDNCVKLPRLIESDGSRLLENTEIQPPAPREDTSTGPSTDIPDLDSLQQEYTEPLCETVSKNENTSISILNHTSTSSPVSPRTVVLQSLGTLHADRPVISKSLGVRKLKKPPCESIGKGPTKSAERYGKSDVIQQLKRQNSHIIKTSTAGHTIIIEDDIDIPDYRVEKQAHAEECYDISTQLPQKPSTKQHAVFVGHPPESSSSEVPTDTTCVLNHDTVYDFDMEEKAGLLTPEESMELYTAYFMPIAPQELNGFYDPIVGIHTIDKDLCTAYSGTIGHSTTSQRLLRCISDLRSLCS